MLILTINSSECEFYVDISDVLHSKDLIQKKSLKQTQFSVANSGMNLKDLQNSIENIKVTPPNKLFDEFSGKVKLRGSPKAINVNINNLVVSGSTFTDISWVLGIVVYTGMESKLWINLNPPNPFKMSNHKKLNNKVMIFTSFFILFFIVLSFFLGYFRKNSVLEDSFQDLAVNNILIFSTIIPISLYLSFKLSKNIQVFLINKKNSKIQVNKPEVLSQLGKIEYIITEKIGILTEDKVEVKICAIKDRIYYSEDQSNSEYLSDDFIESDFYLNNGENLNTPKRPLPNFDDLKADISDSAYLSES